MFVVTVPLGLRLWFFVGSLIGLHHLEESGADGLFVHISSWAHLVRKDTTSQMISCHGFFYSHVWPQHTPTTPNQEARLSLLFVTCSMTLLVRRGKPGSAWLCEWQRSLWNSSPCGLAWLSEWNTFSVTLWVFAHPRAWNQKPKLERIFSMICKGITRCKGCRVQDREGRLKQRHIRSFRICALGFIHESFDRRW